MADEVFSTLWRILEPYGCAQFDKLRPLHVLLGISPSGATGRDAASDDDVMNSMQRLVVGEPRQPLGAAGLFHQQRPATFRCTRPDGDCTNMHWLRLPARSDCRSCDNLGGCAVQHGREHQQSQWIRDRWEDSTSSIVWVPPYCALGSCA